VVQLFFNIRFAVDTGRGGVIGGIFIYFGFLTILTNIAVGLAFTAPVVAPESRLGRFFHRPDVVAGTAATVLFVGVVYWVMLRHRADPEGLEVLADVILHYVNPVVFAGYWWLVSPKETLGWLDAGKWVSCLLAYAVYIAVRGELTGHYPYALVDVAEIGYTGFLINSLGFVAVFAVISLVVLSVARLQNEPPLGADGATTV